MNRMRRFSSKFRRPDTGQPGPKTVPTGSAERRAPLIELSGVSRTFDSEPPVMAVREVSLVVQRGEWVAVVGRSGSGKSTLLNILGLLDVPTAGTYRFNGLDAGALNDISRSGLRGRGIGFVFQSFHLLPFRTALENVAVAELYNGTPRAGRGQRAMAALTRVGLADRAHFLPTRLSGGQRQRVAVARALICRPQLLLCDEPTGNLDSETAEGIIDLFGELATDGMTILVITHDDAIARRAERVVRMVDGTLVEPPSAELVWGASAL